MDHYSTLGEQNEPAGRERGREMGTELRDGVRYKNVQRRRMLNEQQRDEAGGRKSVERVQRRRESHTAPTLTCVPVSGSLPSSPFFSLLLRFRGGFPAPGPNPSQGLSSGSSPKLANRAKKWVVSPGDGGMRE